MPYWGGGPTENDYAFSAMGVYVYLIKDRMFDDAKTVIEKKHPEQAMVASVRMLRLLATEYGANLRVHIHKSDLRRIEDLFQTWLDVAGHSIPKKYHEQIRRDAEREFSLFRESVWPEK